MGYMGMDKEFQLNLIVDEIIGNESNKLTYNGVKFNYNSIITEEFIKEFAQKLKELYPQHINMNTWFPARFFIGNLQNLSLRDTVEKVIATGDWIGREGPYSYNESDCQEIVLRCAEAIKKRLEKYAKRYTVRYKIFKNGEVGFRYE